MDFPDLLQLNALLLEMGDSPDLLIDVAAFVRFLAGEHPTADKP